MSAAQHALVDCRRQAMIRSEIWQVICDHGRFVARPRRFDVRMEAVVGQSGSDGVFYVSPAWRDRALAEGWK